MYIPDFKELAIIKLTVGPGTTMTKKLAIKKYIISIKCRATERPFLIL